MLLNRSFPLVQAAAMDVCDRSICAFGPEWLDLFSGRGGHLIES